MAGGPGPSRTPVKALWMSTSLTCWSFRLEFPCHLHAGLGFLWTLWFPFTVHRHAGWGCSIVHFKLTKAVVWPYGKLVNCPERAPHSPPPPLLHNCWDRLPVSVVSVVCLCLFGVLFLAGVYIIEFSLKTFTYSTFFQMNPLTPRRLLLFL